ncbi:hypothetical protein BSKO_01721 [Bryopsis sp. KO-2023]|nr:hypothetical protein BSKO_01721 [Bryopsis sp. KO-2023]
MTSSIRTPFSNEAGRPYDEEELTAIFREGDQSMDSSLDVQEFCDLMKSRGVQESEEVLRDWFAAIDEDSSGSLSIRELVEYISHDGRLNHYTGEKRSKAEIMGIAEGAEIEAQADVQEGLEDMFVDAEKAKADVAENLLLQHASGISLEMVKHLFLDLDTDLSGKISTPELYLLAPMLGMDWDEEEVAAIVKVADKNGDGEIDFDEFYGWCLKNVKVDGKGELKKRERELELQKYNDVDPKLLKLLEETCHDVMQEAPERPAETEKDQFGQGRFLKEHLMSCYLQAKVWKADQAFCNAALFHAIYEPGFQFRVIELQTARPFLRYVMGVDGEWLLYNFIGASRSIFNPDGLYHSPRVPGSWNQIDFETGEHLVVPAEKRRDLVRLEFTNNYDKMYLHDETDPVKSLWLYCQHINVYDLLLDGQKEIVDRYGARGKDATCEEVALWHEKRFKGVPVTPTWAAHIAMFREGGQYGDLEKQGKLFS